MHNEKDQIMSIEAVQFDLRNNYCDDSDGVKSTRGVPPIIILDDIILYVTA